MENAEEPQFPYSEPIYKETFEADLRTSHNVPHTAGEISRSEAAQSDLPSHDFSHTKQQVRPRCGNVWTVKTGGIGLTGMARRLAAFPALLIETQASARLAERSQFSEWRSRRGLVTLGMEIGSSGAFESAVKVARRTGCCDWRNNVARDKVRDLASRIAGGRDVHGTSVGGSGCLLRPFLFSTQQEGRECQ